MTSKQSIDEFERLLEFLQENTIEASEDNSYNQFCSEMFKRPKLWRNWLGFAIETIKRLATSKQKHQVVKEAEIIFSMFPEHRQHFPGKKLMKRQDYEYWMSEFRKLNFRYIMLAKALVCMVAFHGELETSRKLLEEVDESLLVTDYVPETDTVKIGTMMQAKKWTVGDQMVENPEFAVSQKAAFNEESGKSFEREGQEPVALKEPESPIPEDCPMGYGEHRLSEEERREANERALKVKPGKHCQCTVEKKNEVDFSRLDLID